MKSLLLCLLLCIPAGRAFAAAQFEEFSYQGHLELNGQPATGTYPMTFTLFDAATGGNQVGAPESRPSVAVTGGAFGVLLSYPGAFTGTQLWLEIVVNGQTLGSRQRISAAPAAQFALNGGRMLDYNEPNPDASANPPSHFLNSIGPFNFYRVCSIDGSGNVTAQLIAQNDDGFDDRRLVTTQANDAGPVDVQPGSALDGTSSQYVISAMASAPGNFRRLWGTYVLHSHGSPTVDVSVILYMASDARAATTGCNFQGTVTLGL